VEVLYRFRFQQTVCLFKQLSEVRINNCRFTKTMASSSKTKKKTEGTLKVLLLYIIMYLTYNTGIFDFITYDFFRFETGLYAKNVEAEKGECTG